MAMVSLCVFIYNFNIMIRKADRKDYVYLLRRFMANNSKYYQNHTEPASKPHAVHVSSSQLVMPSSLHRNLLHMKARKKPSMSIKKYAAEWCAHIRYQYPLDLGKMKDMRNLSHLDIIHIHPYNYILNPTSVCEQRGYGVRILSIVKSKITNFKLRNDIRITWGKLASNDRNVIVFAVGYSKDKNVQDFTWKEFQEHGDIIQQDFIDGYYNNTLKTCMTIRWTATFCPNTEFVFMVDDDVAVNFENLDKFYGNVSSEETKTLYNGKVTKYQKPFRRQGDKWRVSREEYPFDCYPPFLPGAMILTSGDVIRKFNSILPYVKRYRYDDVYIGILAQKLGIVPTHNELLAINTASGMHVKDLIASHDVKSHKSYVMSLNKIQNVTIIRHRKAN